jgi:hypothetical protein
MMCVLADCDREQRLHCASGKYTYVKSIFSATHGSWVRLISIFEELSANLVFHSGPWNFHISFTRRLLKAKWLFCEYTLQPTESSAFVFQLII